MAEKKKKKKVKTWVKPRHKVIRNLAAAVILPYLKMTYKTKVEKFKGQGKRNYLVLMNHQTPMDQFFVSMAFKGAVYYVTSEDLFSNGFVSKLLSWAVAPIPIKKQVADVRAVMNSIKIAKEGGTIALFPEGNRTYSGKTEYFSNAVVGYAKALKLPIAIMRLEGGYGVCPRWSDKRRKGPSKAYVARVIEREEYSKLSDEELYALLKQELFVDETKLDGEYKTKNQAEYIERALYVCPECGLSHFESSRDLFTCKKCGKQVRYLPNKKLECVNGELPFTYFNEWYDYQSDFVRKLDMAPYETTPIYEEENGLYLVEKTKKVCLAKAGKIAIFANKITLSYKGESLDLPFDKLSGVSVLGRNKLNIYAEDKLYQLKGNKRFNALKYVNLYYHGKSVMKGEENGQFLGL
ncbi:MAG: 1-acyl-sn-glycerol-3-phosphate acyltransferase [Clostridia bacterium]|nr:1-acyl-sn-glycerol-3-phosphate acyltransferase [Clostridia bacterium]